MNPRRTVSVLWLDDEPEHLTHFVMSMEQLGFAMTVATTSGEALHHVGRQAFDVVISDLFMPPPDGTSFLREAAALQPHAVFIAVSAFIHNNEFRWALRDLEQSGVPLQVISKPLRLQDLLDAIWDGLKDVIPRLPEDRKSFWRRFLENIQLKPSFAGMSVDVKGILGLPEKK